MVATDGDENGAVAAGFGEALGLIPLAFAFLTAQALRAFSECATAAHSVRRLPWFVCRFETSWPAGTDTPVAGSDEATARDGSALAANASTVAPQSTTQVHSRQIRTASGRPPRNINQESLSSLHPPLSTPRGTFLGELSGGLLQS
jgi:hypothetical protein